MAKINHQKTFGHSHRYKTDAWYKPAPNPTIIPAVPLLSHFASLKKLSNTSKQLGALKLPYRSNNSLERANCAVVRPRIAGSPNLIHVRGIVAIDYRARRMHKLSTRAH
jgi:hypothetical protein